ncbi:hypothetical protein E2562_019353 [Oryza meyeriana var. granulata]|uniref:Uncharacterized protein n=1 Tax=Oryza meyeriana var. granulata TaxID=110450 RepID=A0A6G1BLU4_9ORYZ|nr:hypothetical protein E2562_019353 [Oryza meyeriana var. granulata]
MVPSKSGWIGGTGITVVEDLVESIATSSFPLGLSCIAAAWRRCHALVLDKDHAVSTLYDQPMNTAAVADWMGR